MDYFEIMTYKNVSVADVKKQAKVIQKDLQEFADFKHVVGVSHSHAMSPDGRFVNFNILVHFRDKVTPQQAKQEIMKQMNHQEEVTEEDITEE